MTAWLAALLVSGIAAFTDWRTGLIPNWLTLPTALLGLGFHLASAGWAGLGWSLAGLAALERLTPEGRLASLRGANEPARVVLRDARREEYFFAAYEPDGRELIAPEAIAQAGALATVRARLGERLFRVVGLSLPDRDSVALEPDASSVALLAELLEPSAHPLEPNYVRGSGAIRPNLPPSPLAGPRSEAT